MPLTALIQVVAEADGYQPYLLSPEKGLRLLIKRSLELAKQPSLDCVDEVSQRMKRSRRRSESDRQMGWGGRGGGTVGVYAGHGKGHVRKITCPG